MLNLYTANLAEYVAGNSVGAWITLPTDEDTISAHLKAVLGINEEIAIHDYESDYPITVGEYSNIYALNRTAEALERVAEDDRRVITLIADSENIPIEQAIDEFTDGRYTIFRCESLEELGNYLNDEGMLSYEIPEELTAYIDFERLAEDWLMGGNYIDLSEHGFYVTY